MAYFSTSFKRLMIFTIGFVILVNTLTTVKADSTIESNAANIDLLWNFEVGCQYFVFRW